MMREIDEEIASGVASLQNGKFSFFVFRMKRKAGAVIHREMFRAWCWLAVRLVRNRHTSNAEASLIRRMISDMHDLQRRQTMELKARLHSMGLH